MEVTTTYATQTNSSITYDVNIDFAKYAYVSSNLINILASVGLVVYGLHFCWM